MKRPRPQRPRSPIPRMASIATLIDLAERGIDGASWYAIARQEVCRGADLLGVAP